VLDGRGVRFLGQSHFPDCLVLMEGKRVGGGLRHHKDDSTLQTFLLTLKSLILCGNRGRLRWKKGGSALRGQAYRTSRKSRTQEVGTDY